MTGLDISAEAIEHARRAAAAADVGAISTCPRCATSRPSTTSPTARLVSGYRFTRGAEEVAATALHHLFACAQINDLLGSHTPSHRAFD